MVLVSDYNIQNSPSPVGVAQAFINLVFNSLQQ
jgi:hypothetical protein